MAEKKKSKRKPVAILKAYFGKKTFSDGRVQTLGEFGKEIRELRESGGDKEVVELAAREIGCEVDWS